MLKSQLLSHRVDLKDCSIFYQHSGLESSSTPILFLHGWGISTEPYYEVLEQLRQQHSVIAPDLPSFGRSSYSQLIPDYDSYAQFLLLFLEALNLKQVHIVGHSLGGGIAIALYNLAPEKIKSLLLVDSTGIPSGSILELVPRRAIEMIAQISIPKLKLQLIDIPKVFTNNLLFNTGNVIQGLQLSLNKDISDLLPKIQAPCLLLWSEKDLTTPLNNAHEMAAIIPNSKLVTVKEGFHEWGLWHPEKFTSLLLDFIHQVEFTNTIMA